MGKIHFYLHLVLGNMGMSGLITFEFTNCKNCLSLIRSDL